MLDDEHKSPPRTATVAFGDDVHKTTLPGNFDFGDHYRKYRKQSVPLLAIDLKGQWHTLSAGKKLVPGQKQIMLSLVEPEQDI